MGFAFVLVLAAALSPPASPQTEVEDAVVRLARLKRVGAAMLARMPDYTCLETIDRTSSPAAGESFRQVDHIEIEVAHAGDRELFGWPGETFAYAHPGEMVTGALTSTGDFSLHARALFVDSPAQFTFRGAEPLAGRAAWRYDFRIAQAWSGWKVTYAGAGGVVGSTGSIWVDAESLRLLRLERIGTELPPGLAISQVRTAIDYGRVEIGATDAWLPQRAETEMTTLAGRTDRNRTEFSHCREYGAQSALRFDPGPAVEAPTPLRIASGLAVPIRLLTPVGSQQSQEGGRIEAEVTADVMQKRKLAIPQGARLTGRIRRLERYTEPVPHFIVSLEFTTIAVADRRSEFFGQLLKTDPAAGLSHDRPGAATADLPGVGTFFIEGREFLLPAGWPMVWRTVRVGR